MGESPRSALWPLCRSDGARRERDRGRPHSLVSALPNLFPSDVEHDSRVCVGRQPRAHANLVLELRRSPSRIAHETHDPSWAPAVRNRFEHLARRGSSDTRTDVELLGEISEPVVRPIQEPNLLGRHGPANPNAPAGRNARYREIGPEQELLDRHELPPVDHPAESALWAVRREKDDGAIEVGVAERRRRDEQSRGKGRHRCRLKVTPRPDSVEGAFGLGDESRKTPRIQAKPHVRASALKAVLKPSVTLYVMFQNLMTVKEVAALLRVSPQTLYKMLEQRSIPAVKVGSQWRFEQDQIREWIRRESGSADSQNAAAEELA